MNFRPLMTLPYTSHEMAIIGVIMTFGSLLQGALGFASGLLGVPLLVLSGFSLLEATVINFISTGVQNVAGAAQLWDHLEWRDIVWPTGLALRGIAAGTLRPRPDATPRSQRRQANHRRLSAHERPLAHVAPRAPRDQAPFSWTAAAFLTSGFLMGFGSIGGAPMVMYVNSLTWNAAKSRGFLFFCSAALVPIMAVMLAWKFHAGAARPAQAALLIMPPVIVALWIGLKLGHALDKTLFRQLTYGLLIAVSVFAMASPLLQSLVADFDAKAGRRLAHGPNQAHHATIAPMYTPEDSRYDAMRYHRCGRSGLKLPAVSLGLWHNFGGVDDFEIGRAIVRRAFDRGVTHFDLANNYGPPPGSAEHNFGRMLALDFAPYRDELIISTKAGYLMWPGPYGDWGSRKYLLTSLDQSLARLGLDYVDIFYTHRLDPETPLEETLGAVATAIRQGKALYAGISNYTADQTRQACRILRDLGCPCLIHQPKYSMFERWVENGLLDVLAEEGVGCIPFSPLAQGLLTDRYLSGIPADSRAAKPHGFLKQEQVSDAVLAKVRKLNDVAAKRGQSLAQMALAWVLRDPRITTVLIGASSVAQLDQNLACLDRPGFSPEELAAIEAILTP